jgi:stalled ribosome rescue protein Dom34
MPAACNYVGAIPVRMRSMRLTLNRTLERPEGRNMNATGHYHVIVWIDHSEARIFGVGIEDADHQVIRTHAHQRHLHHKANSGDSGHAPIDKEFFERIAQSLAAAGALLITGPASAKTELVTFLKEHHPQLAQRISAVEALDHPTDGMLVAIARKFFRADDRMR